MLPLLKVAFGKYPPVDGGLLFLDSLKYSMPLLLLFAWAAVRLVRGRSSSHYEIVVVWGLALVAFPLVGLGLDTLMNGWLDNSASSSHTVVVRDKYVSKQKSSTYYRLVLASWRPKEGSEILEVSSSEYQRATPLHTKVRVVTKPGRFGFEWRVSYDILADGPW